MIYARRYIGLPALLGVSAAALVWLWATSVGGTYARPRYDGFSSPESYVKIKTLLEYAGKPCDFKASQFDTLGRALRDEPPLGKTMALSPFLFARTRQQKMMVIDILRPFAGDPRIRPNVRRMMRNYANSNGRDAIKTLVNHPDSEVAKLATETLREIPENPLSR